MNCLIGTTKVRTKKARWKEFSIGWEFVGVLVGVLPFFGFSVGVLTLFGGSFGFSVGVLVGVSRLVISSPQQCPHLQGDIQIVAIAITPYRSIVFSP